MVDYKHEPYGEKVHPMFQTDRDRETNRRPLTRRSIKQMVDQLDREYTTNHAKVVVVEAVLKILRSR